MQGKTPIETFTYQDKTVGEAISGGWYLLSNDLNLLRQTIEMNPQDRKAKLLEEQILRRLIVPIVP